MSASQSHRLMAAAAISCHVFVVAPSVANATDVTAPDPNVKAAVVRIASSAGTDDDYRLIRNRPDIASHLVDPKATEQEVKVTETPLPGVQSSGSGVRSARPSGCKSIDHALIHRTVLRNVAYAWHQHATFCYAGGKITKWTNRYPDFTNADRFYTAQGMELNRVTGSTSRMKQTVENVIPIYGHVAFWHPWSSITAHPDGTYKLMGADG